MQECRYDYACAIRRIVCQNGIWQYVGGSSSGDCIPPLE
jgi:hypothetical protein